MVQPVDVDVEAHLHTPNWRAHPAVETLQLIAFGGFSNNVASTFTSPVDIIKVRQQLQNVGTLAPTKVKSTFWGKTLMELVKKEGVFAVYKGWSPSMLREISYSGIRFGIYDFCKDSIVKVAPSGVKSDSFSIKLMAGMISGAVGSAVANPADVLKIRMQSPNATGNLRSHIAAVYSGGVAGAGSLSGFYRGLAPTISRAAVLTAAQLGSYDESKHKLIDDFGFQEGFGTHLLASGIAGFVCSAVSAPIDTIKVRMMADVNHRFSSSIHCCALLLKNEGPLALYSGATMCFLRLWPQSVISLLVFEYVRSVAGLNPI